MGSPFVSDLLSGFPTIIVSTQGNNVKIVPRLGDRKSVARTRPWPLRYCSAASATSSIT